MAYQPGACPPGPYDASTGDCIANLTALLNAYYAAVAGGARVVVRHGDRWSEYSKPQAPALLQLYQTFYAQCPGAKRAGLPDLNPNLRVQRGKPARGFFTWPHL